MAQQLLASNWVILALCLAMMVLDLVTGYVGAWQRKEIKSDKMRTGLFHKASFCFLIIMGFLLELSAQVADLGIPVPATAALCVWIILIEANSVWENIIKMNPEAAALPFKDVFKLNEE